MAQENKHEEETGKKKFLFKGKTVEELKTLDVREFAKYLKSTPRRYLLRNFQAVETFLIRSREKNSKKKQIKTHDRELIVVPEMVGWRIHVHKGNGFEQVDIVEEMLGHRLGEFAPTRKKVNHTKSGAGATKGKKVIKK